MRSPFPKDEGAAEIICDCNHHSLSLCAAGGEEVENLGVKLSPGKRQGWGKGVIKIGFISHYPALI